jgi:hypothetical protein
MAASAPIPVRLSMTTINSIARWGDFVFRKISGAGRAGLLALIVACSTDSLVGAAPREVTAGSALEPNYSFSVTPATRTVHVRFARVRADGPESVSAFMQRVFASADAAGATRLVLDLSSTKGGDSFLVVPLVKGIMAREQLAKRGGLVVIVGPDSFSQAQNTAAMLGRYAQPIFVDHPIS